MVPVLNSHALDFDQAFDESSPRALINIVPTFVQNAMRAIPKDLLNMDLDELANVKAVKDRFEKLEMLRTAFWLEYNRAQKSQSMMNMSAVFASICMSGDFRKHYVSNSFCLLYMIVPPKDYTVIQHLVLQRSMEMELKILSMNVMKPVFDKGGVQVGEEIDPRILAVQQKIAESMRNRLMGMPVNRSMQINRNYNTGGEMPNGTGPNLNEMSTDELEGYVEQLKKRHGVDEESSEKQVTIDVKLNREPSDD
jgi:hypothetical protein